MSIVEKQSVKNSLFQYAGKRVNGHDKVSTRFEACESRFKNEREQILRAFARGGFAEAEKTRDSINAIKRANGEEQCFARKDRFHAVGNGIKIAQYVYFTEKTNTDSVAVFKVRAELVKTTDNGRLPKDVLEFDGKISVSGIYAHSSHGNETNNSH